MLLLILTCPGFHYFHLIKVQVLLKFKEEWPSGQDTDLPNQGFSCYKSPVGSIIDTAFHFLCQYNKY